jgi:predicted PurR-regulated permease PerM
MDRWPRSSPATSLGVAVLAVAVLYFAKPVLLPLAVAVLLNVVLSPAVKRLERSGVGRVRIGRIGAVLVVTLAIAAVFAGIGWIVGVQGGALAEELPEYRRSVLAQLREPLDSLRSLERTAREVRELTEPPSGVPRPSKVEVVEGGSEVVGLARDWAGSVASLLGAAGLVIVLLVFLLIEREGLRDRVIRVASGDLRATTSAFSDAVDRVTRYVRALALLNLGHGAIIALGLWLIGVPGALLLGLLSALLRFVPYLGPWLAAGLALLAALASSQGWAVPVTVAVFLASVELISNNVLEPWLFGTRLGVSPFALIVSTIFWAWLWGPIGLVLATPLTACLVAFGRYAPSLEPLAILLSDEDGLPPAERLYQRVLARDAYEATALVAERAETLGALAAWDETVLPAWGLLERDRREQRLDAEQLEVAGETLEELLSDLPEPATPGATEPAVLCLPARGGSDEVVCAALARSLAAAGVSARAIGHKLSAELAEEVRRASAALVCISSLAGPPGAALQLVMRIRKCSPDTKILVGLWGQQSDASLRDRIGADAGTRVVGGLVEAVERVRGATAT